MTIEKTAWTGISANITSWDDKGYAKQSYIMDDTVATMDDILVYMDDLDYSSPLREITKPIAWTPQVIETTTWSNI